MNELRCLRLAAAIAAFLAGLSLPALSQPLGSTEKTDQARLLGNWTVVYYIRGRAQAARPFVPWVTTITKDRFDVVPKENPMRPGRMAAYRLHPEGRQGAIDFFDVDEQGRIIEKTKEEGLYFLRDDFLILHYGSGARANSFDLSANWDANLMILRRGKLKAPIVSQTFPSDGQPKEKDSIEGVWAKIYYECQDVFLSFANMSDLATGNGGWPRRIPFAEYVPLQWKVSKQEIEEGGENDLAGVHRFAYALTPEKGTVDMTPLDGEGNKIEKRTKLGVYFVKDDFLFIRYGLEQRDLGFGFEPSARPDRVFTSDLKSYTGLLILRRGPLK